MAKENITFYIPQELDQACRFFECIENLEFYFGIEFSCGEGKFMSELMENYDENSEVIERLDGGVVENCIKIKKTGKVHIGDFKISFKYDPDYRERGTEMATNMKVSTRV